MGKEQLVWAVIFIVFIIFTALKNRNRNKHKTPAERTKDTGSVSIGKEEKIVRYLEGIFGVERPQPRRRLESEEETIMRAREEGPKPIKKRKIPKPAIVEKKQKEKIGEFTSTLIERFKKEEEALVAAEKKDVSRPRLPWRILIKKDLKSAIILSEIIGPPISKRKGHRLF